MADELSGLHIDTDWKKQAQEEKKRLAEEEQKRAAQQAATRPAAAATPGVAGSAAATAGRTGRQAPVASFSALVQSTLTQVLYYLGELTAQGMEPAVNLDMAKYHLDTLGILEEKTRNNLGPDESHLLDIALYESRNRFVSVASQYI